VWYDLLDRRKNETTSRVSRLASRWNADAAGLLPSLTLYPRGDADLWVETRAFLGGGQIVTSSQGPLRPTGSTLQVQLSLPAEIGEAMALVSVLVTAKDPQTGAPLARRSARAVAYRESGSVVLVTEEAAVALTADVGVEADGLVEDGLVGREVVR
jgi:hypothetical protein